MIAIDPMSTTTRSSKDGTRQTAPVGYGGRDRAAEDDDEHRHCGEVTDCEEGKRAGRHRGEETKDDKAGGAGSGGGWFGGAHGIGGTLPRGLIYAQSAQLPSWSESRLE